MRSRINQCMSVLAYLGDSVLEVLVRDYLVKESELVKAK